jgi:hypothetical protein
LLVKLSEKPYAYWHNDVILSSKYLHNGVLLGRKNGIHFFAQAGIVPCLSISLILHPQRCPTISHMGEGYWQAEVRK